MSITFIATLVVKPGKEAEFEALQKELSEDSHGTEPGLIAYDVIRHRDKPQTYVVYARFKDQAAFAALPIDLRALRFGLAQGHHRGPRVHHEAHRSAIDGAFREEVPARPGRQHDLLLANAGALATAHVHG